MTITPDRLRPAIKFERKFSQGDPYRSVEWKMREARIPDHRRGGDAFQADGLEFPAAWSQNAVNIVAQKYFRVNNGVRETSLKQVVDRIADTITAWGKRDGYFGTLEDEINFQADLKYMMVNQMMAFNSPVWFNIGIEGAQQQSSACFILSVEDRMSSILNWITEEGMIFKRGSGAGTNLSSIRSEGEVLSIGGTASGPVSFMRGADASAGSIKSGGASRRAAKMVILNDSHPDIEEFIQCKQREERKIRALEQAGFEMGVDGRDHYSVQYQNANNSVRITDAFMEAYLADENWELKAVKTGEVVKTVSARALMRQIAQAAWECADPGLQYDDTLNRWHTSPQSGRINATNPCAEHANLDNSSCNLASLNLLKFLQENGDFAVDDFRHAVEVTFVAQDILISGSDFPTPKIEEVTKAHRMLGLGYTNLGAVLMCQGLPYDSDDARSWAGAVTAIMTGQAYLTSTKMAEQLGAYSAYKANRDANMNVIELHCFSVEEAGGERIGLWQQAEEIWDDVHARATDHGVRNNQCTLLAPTGTISFAMDADTTGIEPDFSLVKSKALVGGGTMTIVNQAVGRALENLRYTPDQVAEVKAHIADTGTVVGSSLKTEHMPVFACAVGEPSIAPMGHLKMMSAVQPMLSSAISKTVNIPTTYSVEDIEQLYVDAWQMGIKCLAIYRDGSKVGQPLSSTGVSEPTDVTSADVTPPRSNALSERFAEPVREKLGRIRRSKTTSFQVGDCHGYITVGEYDDGRPGEVFLKVAKQGSTLAGLMDSFAISVSHALQYGVPLKALVHMYVNMKFEPFGMTDDPELRMATSIPDYIFRRLALDYMKPEDRREIGVLTTLERVATLANDVVPVAAPAGPVRDNLLMQHLPICFSCGGQMVQAGSCFACTNCGTTSGCS